MCDRNSNIPEYVRNMTWNERQDIDGNGNGYELKWMREHPATPINMRGGVIRAVVLVAAVIAGVLLFGHGCKTINLKGEGNPAQPTNDAVVVAPPIVEVPA